MDIEMGSESHIENRIPIFYTKGNGNSITSSKGQHLSSKLLGSPEDLYHLSTSHSALHVSALLIMVQVQAQVMLLPGNKIESTSESKGHTFSVYCFRGEPVHAVWGLMVHTPHCAGQGIQGD